MDHRSMHKLRFDRRLIRRPGWLSPSEIEREVEALPDVGHKAITLGEAEDDAGGDSGDGPNASH